MSTAQFTVPLITVIPGQLITASLWNNEYTNLFTNLNPSGIGAYSDNDTQMRASTDPFPSGSTSRPTAISGEFERIRFQFVEIVGGTYWYSRPADTIFNLDARITTLNGEFPIQTSSIGDLQVTDAKINDVAATKITGTLATAQIADAAITSAKLDAAIAGNGLAGGAGSALSVNVDSSTIEINSDTLRLKDSGITLAKLAVGIFPQPKTNVSSLIVASGVNGSFGTVLSVSGRGALKGITLKADRGGGASGTATFTIRITLDGTAYTVAGLVANFTNIFQIAPAAWANAKPPTLTNYFTSNAVAGTGSDFYFGFDASLLIELEATTISDANNGFYVATSYEN